MGRVRYNQSLSLSLINGLQHIQNSALFKNGEVTIDLNRNADASMAENLQLAFGGKEFAKLSKSTSEDSTYQITISQSQYNSFVSGKESISSKNFSINFLSFKLSQ